MLLWVLWWFVGSVLDCMCFRFLAARVLCLVCLCGLVMFCWVLACLGDCGFVV